MGQTFLKDPDAVLDYQIDWSDWLGTDTISSSSWTVSGVTKDSDTNTTTTATIWVSGGVVGVTGTAINRIVTTDGRTEDRTLTLTIIQR